MWCLRSLQLCETGLEGLSSWMRIMWQHMATLGLKKTIDANSSVGIVITCKFWSNKSLLGQVSSSSATFWSYTNAVCVGFHFGCVDLLDGGLRDTRASTSIARVSSKEKLYATLLPFLWSVHSCPACGTRVMFHLNAFEKTGGVGTPAFVGTHCATWELDLWPFEWLPACRMLGFATDRTAAASSTARWRKGPLHQCATLPKCPLVAKIFVHLLTCEQHVFRDKWYF